MEKKGNSKRVINGKTYYYEYKAIIMKGDIHDKIKTKAYMKNMSMAKYIEHLIKNDDGK